MAAVSGLEKRHEAMLSIMEDRAENYDRYRTERIPKHSWDDHDYYTNSYYSKKGVFRPGLMLSEKVIMKGCKHKDRYKAIHEKLITLYREERKAEKEKREAEYRKWEEEGEERKRKYLEYIAKEQAMELEELEMQRNMTEEEQEERRHNLAKERERVKAILDQEDLEWRLQERAKALEKSEMERNKIE